MITPQEVGKRIKDLLDGWDEFDEEMRRVSLIQMRNLRPSDRTLRIDADSLLYYVAYAPSYKPEEAIDGGSFIGDVVKVHFKDYKQHFNNLVQDIVTECELASFRNELPRFKDFELVFTPSTNFRYEIFPEYKKNRVNKPQSNILKRLKRWAKARGVVPDNVEADDYVYYHAMKGDPVASGDKDVVNSVPAAYYYHSNHRKVVINTPEERARWILLQTLAGDPSDDIPGLKGVALKTADKLLPDGGTMDDVIKIYESKGYTKDDAILTRRLVGLDQVSYSKRTNRIKVRLFQW
jgi:DNA polymerase-1